MNLLENMQAPNNVNKFKEKIPQFGKYINNYPYGCIK